MNRDTHLLLLLQRMRFLKTKEKLTLLNYCFTIDQMPEKKDMEMILGRKIMASYNREQLLEMVDSDMTHMVKNSIKILFIEDESYPVQLKEIYNPPFLLYYRGQVPPKESLNISVIGTRKASGRALREAYALSFDLARSGAAVISGLAEGIDTEAHKGALAGKNYTAAVFGCGVDRIYPPCNTRLASAILDKGGTLLSEYPPGTLPLKYNFPERNRILSAFSEAVVVVEAPLGSGSMITADFALAQGREVFVLHVPSDPANGAGSKKLVNEGASSVTSALEVLNSLTYKTKNLKSKINISQDYDSLETGRFLAARFLAELRGKEICREGTYYRL